MTDHGTCSYCGALERLGAMGRVKEHNEYGIASRHSRPCLGGGRVPYEGPPRSISDWIEVQRAWVH
jgi:hypothetical protein